MKEIAFVTFIPALLVGIYLGFLREKLVKPCNVQPELSMLRNYSFERINIKKIPNLKFTLKGEIIKLAKKRIKSSEKVKRREEEIVKKLKISVIRGKKNYLLIGPYFIEEGKEYNGIKFLKMDDNYVYIKVGNAVFKKRY